MVQDMKKVKCELCDGRGWVFIARTVLPEPGERAYAVESSKQVCPWCNDKREVPPVEEKNND